MRSINNSLYNIYYRMSLSLHRVTGQRAINRTVQYDNRLTEFTNPPIKTGDLYVKRDLHVYGNTELRDIHATGNAVVDGNVTVGKNITISGNESITGNLTVSGNEDVSGNLRVSGTILASQFLPGQVIFTDMFNLVASDVNIGTATRTISIVNWIYTPSYANSSILIEFQTKYTVSGSNGDNASAQLWVDSSNISNTYQGWTDSEGGGTRSGVIFPIVGKYINSSRSQKTIDIRVYNGTDSDIVTVYRDNSCWLKITEIGR